MKPGVAWVLTGCLFAAPALPGQTQPAEIANTATSAPAEGQSLEGRALLSALRAGGYVIYFRHTATDFSRRDDAMTGYDDCANQRLLSPQGRTDATAIGRRIAALKLPVGEVLASPMCRTMDHARLSFGRATPTPEIREGRSDDYPGLKRLFATPVRTGTNRWIVGHGIPFRAVAGPPHLAEGEAVVIRPLGSAWTVVARVSVPDWAGLGAAAPEVASSAASQP
jgi:Histidine phosphatase superfamily (branch 1)